MNISRDRIETEKENARNNMTGGPSSTLKVGTGPTQRKTLRERVENVEPPIKC